MDIGTDSEDTSPSSPAREDLLSPFLQLAQHHYDFRLNARLTKRPISTWIDTDDSGTYDPKHKRHTAIPRKRARGSLNNVNKDINDNESRKLGVISPRLQSREQEELLVIEGVSGEKVGNVENTNKTADQTNIRQASDKVSDFAEDSAEDETLSHNSLYVDRLSNNHLYSTRRRRRSSRILGSDSHCSTSSKSISTLDDLFDFPSTRSKPKGCKACFNSRVSCPLKRDGSTYPCSKCVKKNCDCILVPSPRKKQACEGCRKVRERCSYREGSDPSLPCKNCGRKGQECVASSKKRSGFNPALERPFFSCRQCRGKRGWCSTKTKDTKLPCNRCLKDGLECSFERLEVGSKKAEEPQQQTAVISKDCAVKSIKTSFAHPITFNHTPNEDGNDPCHWCDAAAFGVMGHGQVEVEIIDRHDRQGYTEVSGGHTSKGVEPTRMCEICTMERVMICTCKDHGIHPLPGRSPKDFDFEAALEQLLASANPTSADRILWCSVCPSPAFFECLTPQVLDLPADGDDNGETSGAPPTASGCGLLLCEVCEKLLTHSYKGDLQAMIANAVEPSTEFPSGLRADVAFLSCDGELMKRLAAEDGPEKEG
ncbi:MAG: hypothetical protein M1840_002960 [Geoglossum simile]|nr:MAG: hypothetical protein M1840_002960 [Geoglossum simile]